MYMDDSKSDPLQYLYCITDIATLFCVPSLWLLHKLHRQYSYRKSYNIKERHFCLPATLFHVPSALTAPQESKEEQVVGSYSNCFVPSRARLARVLISVSSVLPQNENKSILYPYSVHRGLWFPIFLQYLRNEHTGCLLQKTEMTNSVT